MAPSLQLTATGRRYQWANTTFALVGSMIALLCLFTVRLHSLEHRSSPLLSKRAITSFPVFKADSLSNLDIAPACATALYRNVTCESMVSSMRKKRYYNSLGDKALTDSVCADTCVNSLRAVRRIIAGACAGTPELSKGRLALQPVDSMYTGWNETCLRNNATKEYCNDIIDSWPRVDKIEDMPRSQLCSYCYVEKLKTMQRSAYSVYDKLDEERFKYVIKTCKLPANTPTAPTTLGPPPSTNNTSKVCGTEQTHDPKPRDTCDSIALSRNVSAASLNYINPRILNCNDMSKLNGSPLCLPSSCSTTYAVRANDNCTSIAKTFRTSWRDIVSWNSGLNSYCTNLVGAKPSWGSVICVSPPGGLSEKPPADDNGGAEPVPPPGTGAGGQGPSGDGYAKEIVKPPAGARVATNTTALCGEYIQARSSSMCAKLIAAAGTPIDLFLDCNPSLGDTPLGCDGNLKPGSWYCRRPVRGWNGKKDEDEDGAA